MTKPCKDLRISPIGSCLAGLFLSFLLLSWKQSPNLMPLGLMTFSSLLILGGAKAYFHWKDWQLG